MIGERPCICLEAIFAFRETNLLEKERIQDFEKAVNH
jgi:hypothetical protein